MSYSFLNYFFEKKYIGHGVRNIYLYWILFFSLNIIYDFQGDFFTLIVGFIVYVIWYAGVYFLNDFSDRKEDHKKGKKSLYSDIKNKKIFWSLCAWSIIIGVIGSMYIWMHALYLFITLYVLNFFYSFPPLNLRSTTLWREIIFFVLYFVKWIYLMYAVWFYPYNVNFPLALIVAMSAFATIGVFVYKWEVRNIFRSLAAFLSCFFFSVILVISIFESVFLYPKMWLLLLPILPTTVVLFYFFRDRNLPLFTLQTIFFVYMFSAYLLS
jgi:hypothetical protein